ncbi:MAG: HAMP domain-containing sensor histidine kinase [Vicinamibacterales bacterium]
MAGRRWLQPPRRILTSFLVVVAACVGALAWLGYRLLDQDRALESQRIQEQLEVAADLTSASLERSLAELEKVLAIPPRDGKLPYGTFLILADATSVELSGIPRLLFYPEVDTAPARVNDALSTAERIEFQQNAPLAAAALYREVAQSKNLAVRAAALLRLGRSLRRAGRTDEALNAYAELATLDSMPELNLPAALVAREARCTALAEAGRNDELKSEAGALLRDLENGRWRLSRTAYEFRASEARRWIGNGALPPPPAEALALSATVSNLVDEWRARPGPSNGRRVVFVDSQAVLAVWRGTPTRLSAALAGVEYLRAVWNEAVPDRTRTRLALTDAEGQTIFGAPPGPAERSAVRTAAVTNLPWTLYVSAADPSALVSGLAARRRLLLAGLSILALLLLVTSCFIVRAMTRELAVARLQSDFVASVSHEFRSPLTSMRQLSSMLVQGRLASDEQRQRSYAFLADETGRLDRLIEGLLDFGLMEAGEARYRLESTDAVELVRDTVSAFQRTVTARGYQVELSLPASSSGEPADGLAVRHRILADRDALGRAIWNLLDNAVKFSPDQRNVWVDVVLLHDEQRARLAIAVKDRGMGIPVIEHRTIFDKFVRGAASREAGIKGTGIGLAMVKHIIAAHGGEIRLESAPGDGSRFTILLPMETTR